jgi:hypothetical protein
MIGAGHSFPLLPCPGYSAEPPEPMRRHHIVGVTHGIRDAQFLVLLIKEIDREGSEPGHARDELRNLGEEFFEIKHGHDLAPEVEKRRQEFSVERGTNRGQGTHGRVERTDYTECP